MTIVGTTTSIRDNPRKSSRPVIPGMCRSSIRQSGDWLASESRNAWPDSNVATFISAEDNRRRSALRIAASSSTTAINSLFAPIRDLNREVLITKLGLGLTGQAGLNSYPPTRLCTLGHPPEL